MKLPHDLDAERATLGAVLSDPSFYVDVAAIVRPEDFYSTDHRAIFEAMAAVDAREEWTEPVSVSAELRRSGSRVTPLDVAAIAADVPMPSAAAAYARAVARIAAQRRLVSRLAEALDEARDDKLDPATIATSTSLDLLDVVGDEIASARQVGPHVDEALEVLEVRPEGELVETGFRGLDAVLGGMGRGQFVIVASRPGVGKSAFVAQVARNVAGAGLGVGLFSLEMSTFEVTMRLLCSEAGVPFAALRDRQASFEERAKVTAASEIIHALPIFVMDRATVRLPELRAIARRVPKLGLVVVDYIQLLSTAKRSDRREQEVAEISRGLKLLARELGVPVLAACQLNRDPERRQDKRPQLSDLRESGSLEQDADVVVMLYREATTPTSAEAIVAKHRNGPTDTVRLTFRLDLTRFEPRY